MEGPRSHASGRLGPRVLALLAGASLAIGALWWFLAELAFRGDARSLLGVDALALALAAAAAFCASPRWRGRALALLLVVGLAVVALGVAFLVYNALDPTLE